MRWATVGDNADAALHPRKARCGSGRRLPQHSWQSITGWSSPATVVRAVVDLDLRVKPRDPEASIRVALRGVQCPRCNGHGRPRIMALARRPSIFGT